MGKMSRDKGKIGEREVAAILRENGFEGAKRGVQYKGGPGSPDVVGLPGFHVEVKRTESINVYKAMKQAEKDSAGRKVPVVVHRRNSANWLAILTFDAFLDLIRERDMLLNYNNKLVDTAINPPVVIKEQPEELEGELAQIKTVEDYEELEDELAQIKTDLDWEQAKVSQLEYELEEGCE